MMAGLGRIWVRERERERDFLNNFLLIFGPRGSLRHQKKGPNFDMSAFNRLTNGLANEWNKL